MAYTVTIEPTSAIHSTQRGCLSVEITNGSLLKFRSFAIANLQKMAVAERREAETTTGRRNEIGLAVRQATIKLLAESCRH